MIHSFNITLATWASNTTFLEFSCIAIQLITAFCSPLIPPFLCVLMDNLVLKESVTPRTALFHCATTRCSLFSFTSRNHFPTASNFSICVHIKIMLLSLLDFLNHSFTLFQHFLTCFIPVTLLTFTDWSMHISLMNSFFPHCSHYPRPQSMFLRSQCLSIFKRY